MSIVNCYLFLKGCVSSLSLNKDLDIKLDNVERVNRDVSKLIVYFEDKYDSLIKKLELVKYIKRSFGNLVLQINTDYQGVIHVIIYDGMCSDLNHNNRLFQIEVTVDGVRLIHLNKRLIMSNRFNWFRIKLYIFGLRSG